MTRVRYDASLFDDEPAQVEPVAGARPGRVKFDESLFESPDFSNVQSGVASSANADAGPRRADFGNVRSNNPANIMGPEEAPWNTHPRLNRPVSITMPPPRTWGEAITDRGRGMVATVSDIAGGLAEETSKEYAFPGQRLLSQVYGVLGRFGSDQAQAAHDTIESAAQRDNYATAFADSSRELSDLMRSGQSDREQFNHRELAAANEAGSVELLKYLATHPQVAGALASDSMPYMYAGGAVGKALRTANAGKTAAVGGALTTEAALAANAAADGARQQIRNLTDDQLADLPDFEQLRTKYGTQGARHVLAERAANVTGAVSAVSNALVLGGTAKLQTIERIAGAGAPTGSRIVNAGKTAGAEMLQEAPQGFGDQFAQNVGVSGVDPTVGLSEGLGQAAIFESAAAAPVGAATGFLARPKQQVRTGDPQVDAGAKAAADALRRKLDAADKELAATVAAAPAPTVEATEAPTAAVQPSVAQTPPAPAQAATAAPSPAIEALETAPAAAQQPAVQPATGPQAILVRAARKAFDQRARVALDTARSAAGDPQAQMGETETQALVQSVAQEFGVAPDEILRDRAQPAAPQPAVEQPAVELAPAPSQPEPVMAAEPEPAQQPAPQRPSKRRDPRQYPEDYGLPPRSSGLYDDLLDFAAANGGLDRDAWAAEGVDPATWGERVKRNHDPGRSRSQAVRARQQNMRRGQPIFRRGGGMTPDQFREKAQEAGYFPAEDPNAPPVLGTDEVLQAVMGSLNQGERHLTQEGQGYDKQIEGIERQRDDEFRAEQEAASDAALAAEVGVTPDELKARVSAEYNPDMLPAELGALSGQDVADALTYTELVDRAMAHGATDQEIDAATLSFVPGGDVEGQIARNLWRLIDNLQGRTNADDQGTTQEDAGGVPQAGERASQSVPAGLQPAEGGPGQAEAPLRSGRGADLFAAPTTGEEVRARSEAVDERLRGAGTAATMRQGAGDLFAGPRPEQTRIPDAAPEATGELEVTMTEAGKAKAADTLIRIDAEVDGQKLVVTGRADRLIAQGQKRVANLRNLLNCVRN